MKWLFAIPLCLLLVLMNYLAARALRKKNPLAKALWHLVIAVTVTVFFGAIPVFAPTEETALFFQCVHYISTEWLLIFLLLFMERYTEDVWSRKSAKVIVYTLVVLDSVSILLNGAFHHVVVCKPEDIGKNGMQYIFTTVSPW